METVGLLMSDEELIEEGMLFVELDFICSVGVWMDSLLGDLWL